MRAHVQRCVLLTSLLALLATPALATWSIILADWRTKEIVIGSATCIQGNNLKRITPVLLVDIGGATAQAAVDGTPTNRLIIWNGFLNGLSPEEILAELAQSDPGHQSRQYGIVDTQGRPLTFSGSQDGAWAGGVVGQVGTIAYAIQGNVLTGEPVVAMAEAAVINTPGGLPEKMMAAMEAARAMGGDGRCSCASNNPTGCGAPPDDFDKSAHIGFMTGSRRGDVDGTCGDSPGCAHGVYYMDLNVKNQHTVDPDPVFQLQQLFEDWRASLVGVPDQAVSRITIAPCTLPNDGESTATMIIEVRDWRDLPATDILDVSVMHDPLGSAGSCSIGPVIDRGGGLYQVELTAGAITGEDTLAVQVTSAFAGPRFLIPSGRLVMQNGSYDLTNDGRIDVADLSVLLASFGTTDGATHDQGDLDGDGAVLLGDLSILLTNFNAGCQ